MDLLAFQKEFSERGIELLGIVPPTIGEGRSQYLEWLSRREPGLLDYMAKNAELRSDPCLLFPDTRTVIVFGLPYYQGDTLKSHGAIAQYARFSDYHRLMRTLGTLVMEHLNFKSDSFRVFVDSAPILERALARQVAGGFIGKNTCFIHEKKGSFFLLGEIFCREQLPLSPAGEDLDCGKCTACQTVCPTGALNKDYQLDAKLCIAYWTIEHRGAIPKNFWPHLKHYYFGCDLCQLACPFNQKEIPRLTLQQRVFPDLFEIATMDQTTYERAFGGTPLTRAKRSGLRRNALIAMHELADSRLEEAMSRCEVDDESPVRETLDQLREELNGHR